MHGEPGIVGQRDEHRLGAGLHHPRERLRDASRPVVLQDRGDVDEEPLAGDGQAARPGVRVGGRAAHQRGDGRADHAVGGEAHRRDRPGQTLRQAHAEKGPGSGLGGGRHRIQGGDGSGLGQPEPTVGVDRPFGVLRRAEVGLHALPQPDQRRDLVVGDTRGVGVAAAGDAFGAAPVPTADRHSFVAESLLHDLAGRGDHHEPVGVDRPGHHGLAQTGAGVDHRVASAAGHRIGGEHARRPPRASTIRWMTTASATVRWSMPLVLRYTTARSVHSDAQQRRTASSTASAPTHVQIGVLLAGEARGGKILGRRGGAYGDRRVSSCRGRRTGCEMASASSTGTDSTGPRRERRPPADPSRSASAPANSTIRASSRSAITER